MSSKVICDIKCLTKFQQIWCSDIATMPKWKNHGTCAEPSPRAAKMRREKESGPVTRATFLLHWCESRAKQMLNLYWHLSHIKSLTYEHPVPGTEFCNSEWEFAQWTFPEKSAICPSYKLFSPILAHLTHFFENWNINLLMFSGGRIHNSGQIIRPHCVLTGIMVNKGNHTNMAEQFQVSELWIIICPDFHY